MKDTQQLTPIESAIALFDESQHLILFNRRLTTLWGLSKDRLKLKPDLRSFFAEIVSLGYWSQAQYLQLIAAVESTQTEQSHYIQQTNGLCLDIYISLTSEQGYIFTFNDITHQLLPANLNLQVVRQQTFVLGLMERLQPASELREIGEFALSYLVQAMGAAFGDIKVITGDGFEAMAHVLTSEVGSTFIVIYGEVAV